MHSIQDAGTLTLFSSLYSQACGAAYEHGKYSWTVPLLRNNLTDEGGVLWPALAGEAI